MDFKTFYDSVNAFITYIDIEKNVTKNTIKSYSADLHVFINFWNEHYLKEKKNISLSTIIERYFVALFNQKITKASIARKISCFKSFERFLKKQGHTFCFNLKRPRVEQKLPTYLTIEEITHILDVIKNHELKTQRPLRDKAIFELLYATGIRCSELCSIKIEDINIQEKIIKIYGKGRQERFVLFGQKALERINEYLEKERCSIKHVQEFLFLNCRNQGLTPRSVQRIIESFRFFLKGSKKITPHKLRHSFATHLLNSGANIRVVQELLGHRTLGSTEKYTHVTHKELKEMCNIYHPLNDSSSNDTE